MKNDQRSRLTFFGADFTYLCIFGILCAFAGWAAENTVRALTLGIIDSRFHVLPFIPIYGVIPFAVQILIGNPNDIAPFGKKLFSKRNFGTVVASNLLSVLLICAAVFFGELIVGNAWEALFGVELWNYANQPFHITQYAGLYSTIGAGLGAYLAMQLIFRPFMNFFEKKGNRTAAIVISAILIPLLLADGIHFILQIVLNGEAPVYWSITLPL